MQPFGGHAYAVRVDDAGLMAFAQRWGETRLRLHEDGASLERRAASQGSLQLLGGGRYFVTPRWLVFSSSDGSDPRENGRRYEATLFSGVPLFVFVGLVAAAAAIGQAIVHGRRSSASVSIAAVALVLGAVTVWWTTLVLSPAPQIVLSGDGGNVASIVAARLHPERFALDPVFSNPDHFEFYRTVLIPGTAVLAWYLGDVGRAYMALSAPLVLIQAIGFFLLGRRLFGGHHIPVLLALSSLVPIYVFSGELWGMLASPLTRSAYAAVFPYLLLAGFAAGGRPRYVLALMVACGAAVYVHPVSAPSVAFGLLTMSFYCKPASTSWVRHAAAMVGCGVVFLVVALPFMVAFADVFPSTSTSADAQIARDVLRMTVGPQYYDAWFAMAELFRAFWLGLLGLAAATLVLIRLPKFRMLLAFVAGVLVASFGVAVLDQAVGDLRGTGPFQIDLIRNVRFVVPIAVVAVFWMLAALGARETRMAIVARSSAVALTAILWMALPNPLVESARATFLTVRHDDAGTLDTARAMIEFLAERPPGTMVLQLPHRTGVEDIQLVGLGVRYGALQPLAYTFKDMNFLAYSSGGALGDWLSVTRRLDEASTDEALARAVLVEIVDERSVDLLLVNIDAPDRLTEAALGMGPVVATTGAWRIVAIDETR